MMLRVKKVLMLGVAIFVISNSGFANQQQQQQQQQHHDAQLRAKRDLTSLRKKYINTDLFKHFYNNDHSSFSNRNLIVDIIKLQKKTGISYSELKKYYVELNMVIPSRTKETSIPALTNLLSKKDYKTLFPRVLKVVNDLNDNSTRSYNGTVFETKNILDISQVSIVDKIIQTIRQDSENYQSLLDSYVDKCSFERFQYRRLVDYLFKRAERSRTLVEKYFNHKMIGLEGIWLRPDVVGQAKKITRKSDHLFEYMGHDEDYSDPFRHEEVKIRHLDDTVNLRVEFSKTKRENDHFSKNITNNSYVNKAYLDMSRSDLSFILDNINNDTLDEVSYIQFLISDMSYNRKGTLFSFYPNGKYTKNGTEAFFSKECRMFSVSPHLK